MPVDQRLEKVTTTVVEKAEQDGQAWFAVDCEMCLDGPFEYTIQADSGADTAGRMAARRHLLECRPRG